MEIEFYGANCFKIRSKNSTIVVDDDLDAHGSKVVTQEKDVLVVTNKDVKADTARTKARLVLDSAGEYEVGDISVRGVQTRGHMDEKGTESATVFQCIHEGATITILGHIHPDISDTIQELAGGTDVLLIPVGGNGFTLDATGAAKAIKTTEPDVVVPSMFHTDSLKFEVPVSPLDDFLKTSGLNSEDREDVLKVGKTTSESGQTKLVVLNIKKA